jgi:hypothetical protein
MQLSMAHLLVVSDIRYHQNSAGSFENTEIFRPKTMFLYHQLLSFEDIENRRQPKDVPWKPA